MYLILSILIAMGESIQFPKPESEMRFGWEFHTTILDKCITTQTSMM